MPIEIKMPALSPTMEQGTLAKWLVKEGDTVKSGDILAEIETDKATMEFETIDEGTITKLLVAEGADGVKVGATIALLATEEDAGEDAPAEAPRADAATPEKQETQPAEPAKGAEPPVAEKGYGASPAQDAPPQHEEAEASVAGKERTKASPLARRVAEQQGVDLSSVTGSGPGGRIVKADVAGEAQPAKAEPTAPAPEPKSEAPALKPAAAPEAKPAPAAAAPKPAAPAAPAGAPPSPTDAIPQESVKLSNMRRTIARRLTESKQQVPHIYLTVDVRLDALLALRTQLNDSLSARGIKLSVNDLLIKAQAVALMEVPSCNVMFADKTLVQFKRADISVAVSIPGGLITPIVTGADTKSIATIAAEMKDLAERARDGKLKPEEYQGGTASLSNMGMFGIKHFDAVINPPQAMILAIGAGEQRPWVVDGKLDVATVMTVTGSFDHRAIDGADGARFMAAFKRLCEKPIGLVA